ncbi:PAS domain S-box protein [Roseateles sp. 22389]|uniref:PAS domain S-box protein n=1 Tax=Roseateles sp. 22389 TaxID=3453916 RepID=UPI003F8683EC
MDTANIALVGTEEERLGRFVSSVTDYAIYMLTPEGHVASWNAGAQRFKGYRPEEVIGEHFSRFYTQEDRDVGLPERALQQARDTGRFEAEGWRVRKDGSRFWASVTIDPVRDDDGRLLGFAKITRDITERYATQLELERAREALFHAQKMEALGKVTGGVAHDFNNLLGVLSNGLVLLRNMTAYAGEGRLLDTMELAVDRGGRLVQQLLSFAKQQPLEKHPCDLSRIIASFEAVLRRAGSGETVLELALDRSLPRVLVDSTQFEAAILNLVANAFDATAPGGRIVVSTGTSDLGGNDIGRLPAGRYVRVSVSDNGQGMSSATRQCAVEPFFTTKGPGKGSGLGLSQVFGMVQQCAGDLRIDSTEGRGTTVTMYLPASDHRSEVASAASTETVLVVDDQPDVLDVTSELFRTLGFDVLSADSGEHALEVLERSQVDVLFSDVRMDGMSGVELARHAVHRCPSLRVILVSGFAGMEGDVPTEGRLHGFPFMAKPYKLNDVIRKLRVLG